MPQISICIPTYNGGLYLEETLISVLAQTYTNYEVIIVDDQSSDNTCDIAREYAARNQRFTFYQNEKNLGLVGNWNRCIELSKGEWVKFVFQDDLIAPTCIEEMLAASTADTWLTICRRDFIFEDGTSEETRHFYEQHPNPQRVFGNDLAFIRPESVCQTAIDLFGINCFGEPSAALIRKEAFACHGLFNPNLAMICDTEYWVRLSIHHGFTYLNKTLASFRVHTGSTSAYYFSKQRYRITLDGIILMHEYIYSQEFTPIRRLMMRCDKQIDLKVILNNKIKEARWTAVDAANNPSYPNPELLLEWKKLLHSYPELNQTIHDIRPLFLLKFYIDRYFTWRFKHKRPFDQKK